MRDAVDILNEQLTAGQRLNIEIGRLRQRESMLEARIEVLELTIARLRAVCDAAFTVVRWDGEEDSLSAWQELAVHVSTVTATDIASIRNLPKVNPVHVPMPEAEDL